MSNELFKQSVNQMAEEVYNTSESKGFWEKDEGDLHHFCLIHSEISEATEAVRRQESRKSEKIPDFLEVEDELADAVIRILQLCHKRGWRIAEAIVSKNAYNKTRKYLHGKRF